MFEFGLSKLDKLRASALRVKKICVCPKFLKRSFAALIFASVTGSCSPTLHGFFDTGLVGFEVTQTFGQLIDSPEGPRVAHFVTVNTPNSAEIRAFTEGVIAYVPDFAGMGPAVVLDPKDRLSSDTDFSTTEDTFDLPRPASVRFALLNLDPSSVSNAAQAAFAADMGSDVPADAGQKFLDGLSGYKNVKVSTDPTITANRDLLGSVSADKLIIVGFQGKVAEIKSFVNPLPYLIAGFPEAQRDFVDSQPPVIGDVWVRASDNAGLVDGQEYLVGASNQINLPNVVYGHMGLAVAVTDTVSATGENIGIHEIGYQLAQIIDDGAGGEIRTLVRSGRQLMNKLSVIPAIDHYQSYFDDKRSNATTRSFVYTLRFKDDPGADPTPKASNAFGSSLNGSLSLASLTSGTYEVTITARDARLNVASERVVRMEVTNDPVAIASANWGLQGTFGPITALSTSSDEEEFLVIPALPTTPFTLATRLTDAPTLGASESFCYKVALNGVDIAAGADPGLYPLGTRVYGGNIVPQDLTFPAEGLHEIAVWIGEDCAIDPNASATLRTIIVMTYELTLDITAQAALGAAPLIPHVANDSLIVGDTLELTLAASGFIAGHAVEATYDWTVVTPTGDLAQAGQTWNFGPFADPGVYTFTGRVTLFGVEFPQTFKQAVLGVIYPAVTSLCTEQIHDLAITTVPAILPVGDQIDFSFASSGTGTAQFEVGSNTSLTASGSLRVQPTAVSGIADDVMLVAQFNGRQMVSHDLTMCALRFLKHDNTAYDLTTEALGISNFVSNGNLPAASAFADVVPGPAARRDIELFRLEYEDASQVAAAQTELRLTISYDVNYSDADAPVDQHGPIVYQLNNKNGNVFRGEFLRLVTDAQDDAVLGDQTVLVPMTGFMGTRGEFLVRAERPVQAGITNTRQTTICRRSTENNNSVDPYRHDWRILLINVIVYRNVANTGPVKSRGAVQDDIDDANQRFSQSCVRVQQAAVDFGGAGSPGRALPVLAAPNTYADGTGFSTAAIGAPYTAEENAFFVAKDANLNTLDVFYVPDFDPLSVARVGTRGRSYPRFIAPGNPTNYSSVVLTQHSQFFVLAHEFVHILANAGHRNGEPPNGLFNVPNPPIPSKAVGGTKRIGPNAGAATAGVGNSDTTLFRTNAETLP